MRIEHRRIATLSVTLLFLLTALSGCVKQEGSFGDVIDPSNQPTVGRWGGTAPLDGADLRVEYSMPANDSYMFEVATRYQELRFFDEASAYVDSLIQWPVDIPVMVEECGVMNAFFQPQYVPETDSIIGSIHMCWELIWAYEYIFNQLFAVQYEAFGLTEDEGAALAQTTPYYAIRFVFFHEVGHAVHFVNLMPFTGRGEDVADQFATWIAFQDTNLVENATIAGFTDGESNILGGAAAFLAFAYGFRKDMIEEGVVGNFTEMWADPHSFDLVRVYNILCWLYANGDNGDGTNRYAMLTEPGHDLWDPHLPESRAASCLAETIMWYRAFELLTADIRAEPPQDDELPTQEQLDDWDPHGGENETQPE